MLQIPEFNNIDINEGLSIFTTISLPSDCGSDAFCRVIKVLLGDAKLTLQGTFASHSHFYNIATATPLPRFTLLTGAVIL